MHQLRHKQLSPLKVVYKSNGTLGIENLKIILTVVITFLVDVLTIIRTGNWVRLVEVVFGLIRYGNIVAIAREAWNELQDVSQEESQQLVDHFAEAFDLENDTVEMLIEEALNTIPRIYQLALDALGLAGTGREIYMELRAIFGGEGKLTELSNRLNAAA